MSKNNIMYTRKQITEIQKRYQEDEELFAVLEHYRQLMFNYIPQLHKKLEPHKASGLYFPHLCTPKKNKKNILQYLLFWK